MEYNKLKKRTGVTQQLTFVNFGAMHQQASIPRILLVTAQGGTQLVDWGTTNAKREKRKRKPE